MTDVRILPTDAGCWVDGVHGWRAEPLMVVRAAAAGFPASDADLAMLGRYIATDLGDRDIDDMEVVTALAEEAEGWLCDHAPAGFTFAWLDGEFFMLPDPTDPHTCPRCRGGIPNDEQRGEYPGALSRSDNKTEICSGCGVEEAMIQMHGGTVRGPEAWPLR